MFINHPLTSATQQTPVLLVCSVWTLRTAHCGLHLNATNSDRFLDLGSPIPVKVLTWRKASNSHLSEWKLLLSPSIPGFFGVRRLTLHRMGISFPCILGISRLDWYFLRPSFTGNLQYFCSNDLPPSTHGFLNEPLLWVLWRTASTRELCTALSSHSNVYGWLRTARTWGLAVVLPDK